MFKCIVLFILVGMFQYIFDYVFRPSKIDLVRTFSTALGLSLGIFFIDVKFLSR